MVSRLTLGGLTTFVSWAMQGPHHKGLGSVTPAWWRCSRFPWSEASPVCLEQGTFSRVALCVVSVAVVGGRLSRVPTVASCPSFSSVRSYGTGTLRISASARILIGMAKAKAKVEVVPGGRGTSLWDVALHEIRVATRFNMANRWDRDEFGGFTQSCI